MRAQEAGAAEVLISNRDATDALVRAGLPPALGRAQRDRARGSGVAGRGLCIKVGEDRICHTLARRPRRRLGRARKYVNGDAKPRSKAAQLKKSTP